MRTAVANCRRKKPENLKWIPYTYRVFYTDGTSHYFRMNVLAESVEAAYDFLVNWFTRDVGYYDEIENIRFISLNKQKVNRMVV